MKGVTFIRAKLHPVAICTDDKCRFTFRGSHFTRPITVRSNAEHHVQSTGHTVDVVIEDITTYSPDSEPEVTGHAS